MDFKNIFKNVDGAKVLSVGVTVLGLAGTLLSGVVEKNNRNSMKNELRDEIIKELSNKEG